MTGQYITTIAVRSAGGWYSPAWIACGIMRRSTWCTVRDVSISSHYSGTAGIILSNKKVPGTDMPGTLLEMGSNRKILDNNFINIISHRPVFFSLSEGFDELVKHIILTTIQEN